MIEPYGTRGHCNGIVRYPHPSALHLLPRVSNFESGCIDPYPRRCGKLREVGRCKKDIPPPGRWMPNPTPKIFLYRRKIEPSYFFGVGRVKGQDNSSLRDEISVVGGHNPCKSGFAGPSLC